ncbi:tryptophan-rich sensory protein, partial [Candidatus Saccharibacteria bacterium]|nr:tryptophan-rich sensory protein [Candidatus Saccharibacteria bacterium]
IALRIYGAQLVFNFLWTPLFFNANLYWLAFVVLLIMWILELVLLIKAYKISRPAFWCLLPYIIWSTFAAYLNISIALLN